MIHLFLALVKAYLLDHPDTLCILIAHETSNPQTGQISAGPSAIPYEVGIAYHLSKVPAKPIAELSIYRYPNLPPFAKRIFLHFTDEGLSVVTKEEASQILEKKKRK